MTAAGEERDPFSSTVLWQVLQQRPESLALVGLDEAAAAECRFTYRALLGWAAEISEQVRNYDVEGDLSLVALVLNRAPLVVAAILGVWSTGAAVVLVPADSPPARISLLCEQASLVLTVHCPFMEQGPAAVLVLEQRPRGGFVEEITGTAVGTQRLCMVVFTSGSTGRPKGVLCDHACLWHSVLCYSQTVGVCGTTRLLWKAPYQWRTAEYELYPAICAGGTLFVASTKARGDPLYLAKALRNHDIDALSSVPSVLDVLIGARCADRGGRAHRLQHVVAVGEPLPRALCRHFLAPGTPALHNFYGLTETGMTVWKCGRMPEKSVAPVGRPQACVQVHVLSGRDGAQVGSGREGHIHFAGVMSTGYLSDQKLSRERFLIASRSSGVPGERLFHTGDLGRWNEYHELEVLGRVDNQVKLNGVRVEVQEIEAVMREACGCRDAAVVQAVADSQTLVAFFVAGAQTEPGGVRSALLERLPSYMVPPHIIALDALPRLANEKVDRSSLRARTAGLMTRSQAGERLEGDVLPELVKYIDSLGLQRICSRQHAAARRLWDNLIVLAMLNIILYHWFWCVVVQPKTYASPWDAGHKFGEVIDLPQLPLADWVRGLFRALTQDWAYGIFIFAAVQEQSSQELFSLTERDKAVVALYFYVGFVPMVVSLLFPAPWHDILFRAETVQRWFLLALAASKGILVLAHHLHIHPVVQISCLLLLLVILPPCMVDSCGHGGALFLPTDWWPKCVACLLTPKEVLCILLYVGAAHTHLWRRLSTGKCAVRSFLGVAVFVASIFVSSLLPSEEAIESTSGSADSLQRISRVVGLVFIVVQTISLACAFVDISRSVHLRCLARWTLGCYVFNLNFLDALFVTPRVRWLALSRLQVGGPLVSGMLTWLAMLVPAVLFMLLVAPLLQTCFITWPYQALLTARRGVTGFLDWLVARKLSCAAATAGSFAALSREPLLHRRVVNAVG